MNKDSSKSTVKLVNIEKIVNMILIGILCY